MARKETDILIVTRKTPYDDGKYIIEALTRRDGLMSFQVTAKNTPKHSAKRIMLRPPFIVEAEYLSHPKFLPRILRTDWHYVYRRIGTDLRKTAVALFMCETVSKILLPGNPDPDFFDYMLRLLKKLDKETFDPDFHLHFMTEISNFAGIRPEADKNGTFFDLNQGKFVREISGTTLNKSDSMLFARFLSGKKPENREERRRILHIWTKYFQIHLDRFRQPEVVEIYAGIF